MLTEEAWLDGELFTLLLLVDRGKFVTDHRKLAHEELIFFSLSIFVRHCDESLEHTHQSHSISLTSGLVSLTTTKEARAGATGLATHDREHIELTGARHDFRYMLKFFGHEPTIVLFLGLIRITIPAELLEKKSIRLVDLARCV